MPRILRFTWRLLNWTLGALLVYAAWTATPFRKRRQLLDHIFTKPAGGTGNTKSRAAHHAGPAGRKNRKKPRENRG